jgi:hypothetical protein
MTDAFQNMPTLLLANNLWLELTYAKPRLRYNTIELSQAENTVKIAS